MIDSIIVSQVPQSSLDVALGFDQYDDRRFPGTQIASPPFKKLDGTYAHGVPKEIEKDGVFSIHPHREFIQNSLMGGADLDSETGKEYLSTFVKYYDGKADALDLTNPEHLLSWYILKQQPHDVASSLEDFMKNPGGRHLVLQAQGEENATKLNRKQTLNKAIATLEVIRDEDNFLVALAQYLSPASSGINKPGDAYLYLSDLIDGKFSDGGITKGAETFLYQYERAKKDKELIYIAADIKRAIWKRIIVKDSKGVYKNIVSNTQYGTTEQDVIDYLLKPEHQEELGLGDNSDQNYSIRYQLKFKK